MGNIAKTLQSLLYTTLTFLHYIERKLKLKKPAWGWVERGPLVPFVRDAHLLFYWKLAFNPQRINPNEPDWK